MAKKKKKGGRNPVEPAEKVVLVGFYTKQKYIDHFGGLAECRKWSKETLEIAVEFENSEKRRIQTP